ncbi:tetratricopeptide repeat protein [Maribellus luteus]|uniref:Tetratricopeptide repeat protein n=1 Tax=Maribellus luteus TaxID=2305463 RepID=A0A399SPP2_9BACT|nr:tetratricopeptide repeat protein [Maribellus luteus]
MLKLISPKFRILPKQLILVVFLIAVSPGLRAQKEEINSLRQQLQTRHDDTLRVIQLNRLGFLYHTSKPDSTMLLANEALLLAQKSNYIRGEARALSVMSNAFYATGNYPKALELQLVALKKYESVDDWTGISNTTGNIGNIHGVLGNYQEALKYNSQTLEIKEKIGDKRGAAVALANIGQIYFAQAKLDSARFYVLQSYDIALRERDIYRERVTSLHLGGIYSEMDEQQMALEYYKNAYDRHNPDNFSLMAALGLAKIYKFKELPDSMLHYANYAYTKAEKEGLTDLVHLAGTFLADYYKTQQVFDSAYAYLEISLAARDSLYNQEKRNKIQALSLEEMARQQEKEEARAVLLQKQKTNLQYIAIAGVIVIFILLFLLLSRSIIVSEKWLSYLGIFILLLVFEFINLYLASQIAPVVNFSAVYTLIVMVIAAAILVPMHHRIEAYITQKMIEKNRKIKIAAAKKMLEKLEAEQAVANTD